MAEELEIFINIASVRARISAAARRVGREPEEVLLVAVSKTIAPEKVNQALAAGITDLGENYLQEALLKQPQITGPARWHYIGHLQRNKAKQAVEAFDLIQSVDNLALVQELSKRAVALGKTASILLQVNTSGEASKSGVTPTELMKLAEAVSQLPNLQVQGLMTIGRFAPDPQVARAEFRLLAGLFRELAQRRLPNIEMKWLSMGMSHDFEVAIEEGANLVRVGTAIFGARRP